MQKETFIYTLPLQPPRVSTDLNGIFEKSTEIGVDVVTPLLCEHSERKNLNHDRLERVLIAAMKQSVKAYLPKLNPLTPFSQFITSQQEQQKLIAYCGNYDEPHAKSLIKKGESILYLIGPEGDFSPQEVDLARLNGFSTVGLGPSRLRTETAGVVVCTMANLINQ